MTPAPGACPDPGRSAGADVPTPATSANPGRIAGAGRPGPVTSELTEPFWQACRVGSLTVQRCNHCGTRFFTPEVACTGCASFDWEWAASDGVGTVYSFTTVHRAAGPGFETPYVVAAVDLDEGWTMMTHIVGCHPDEVRIGVRVHVEFVTVSPTLTLPCFRPAAGQVEVAARSAPTAFS